MLKHRKILFISYYFPPVSGGGVQRSLKFVKYLPSFGWDPVVLAAKNSMVRYHDETLLRDLPQGVSVHRVSRFSLLPFVDGLRSNEKRNYDKNGKPVIFKSGNLFFRPFACAVNRLYDFARYMANNFLYVPDEHIGWLPGAVLKGLFLAKINKVKNIYATGDPWTSFLAAFIISKLTNIPYVIDFRDPWTLDPYYESPGIIHRWLSDKLERLCVRYAQKVLFTCEKCMMTYQAKYRNEPQDKFATITHGYEPDDFKGISKLKFDKFTISFIGTLYPRYSSGLDAFFNSICGILEKNPELREKLQINFFGITRNLIEHYLEKYKVRDIVKIGGYLSHKESVRHMMSASLLLILGAEHGVQIPGKIFEYLAARRPILAIMPFKGDIAFIVKNMSAGIVVDPQNVEDVEKAILYFYQDKWKHPVNYDITKYERKKLAGCLANIFDSIRA